MRAVLYTGGQKLWANVLGDHPWALLPIAARPLLSYWLELCIDLGIRDVQVILGHDAEYIEMFCGTGEKWGLNISYSFVPAEDQPQSYLARDPDRWQDGLLYIGESFFPRRRADFTPERLRCLLDGCCVRHNELPAFFIGTQPDRIGDFIREGLCTKGDTCFDFCGGNGPCNIAGDAGLDLVFFQDVSSYYQLNMEIVQGEMNRYLSGGYSSVDSASIRYNVIIPPSVTLTPPLAIGNDCRIGAISSIGPGTVISDHVLIDRQCELSDCIILSDTYVGRNLEIKGKIVAGNRIIDPEDGTWIDIEDPWLVAQTRPRNYMRDFLRAVFGWEFALLLVLLQVVPFVVMYTFIRLFRRGHFIKRDVWGIGGKRISVSVFRPATSVPNFLIMLFYATSLDRFPQLFKVLTGQLWLCGQVSKPTNGNELKESHRYFPAVFSYSDAFLEIDKQMDALYYAHTRSLPADLRILRHALLHRLIEIEAAPSVPCPA